MHLFCNPVQVTLDLPTLDWFTLICAEMCAREVSHAHLIKYHSVVRTEQGYEPWSVQNRAMSRSPYNGCLLGSLLFLRQDDHVQMICAEMCAREVSHVHLIKYHSVVRTEQGYEP